MHSINKITILTLSILFIISQLNSTASFARRAIPDDCLVLPVLAVTENGTGSGFYVSDKKHTFFITARHVLFKESNNDKRIDYLLRSESLELLSYPKNYKNHGRIILDLDLETLNNSGNIRFHKDDDVAVVCIALKEKNDKGRMSLQLLDGVHVKKRMGSAKLAQVGMDIMIKFDSVLISNDVFIFGYPTSIGIKNIPQIEYDKPLLRRGIVAGLNRTKRTIILACPSYPGNSGGPVLEVDQEGFKTQFRIIGVLSQFIPFAKAYKIQGHLNIQISNSGYSVATPMDPVLELISNFEKLPN
jgi:hypothetical protein